VLLALGAVEVAPVRGTNASATGPAEEHAADGDGDGDAVADTADAADITDAAEDTASAVRYLRPIWTPSPAPAIVHEPATVLVLGAGPLADAVVRQAEASGVTCVSTAATTRAEFDLVIADLGAPPEAVIQIPGAEAPFESFLWAAVAILAHPE
jgi:hypothetical protein